MKRVVVEKDSGESGGRIAWLEIGCVVLWLGGHSQQRGVCVLYGSTVLRSVIIVVSTNIPPMGI